MYNKPTKSCFLTRIFCVSQMDSNCYGIRVFMLWLALPVAGGASPPACGGTKGGGASFFDWGSSTHLPACGRTKSLNCCHLNRTHTHHLRGDKDMPMLALISRVHPLLGIGCAGRTPIQIFREESNMLIMAAKSVLTEMVKRSTMTIGDVLGVTTHPYGKCQLHIMWVVVLMLICLVAGALFWWLRSLRRRVRVDLVLLSLKLIYGD